MGSKEYMNQTQKSNQKSLNRSNKGSGSGRASLPMQQDHGDLCLKKRLDDIKEKQSKDRTIGQNDASASATSARQQIKFNLAESFKLQAEIGDIDLSGKGKYHDCFRKALFCKFLTYMFTIDRSDRQSQPSAEPADKTARSRRRRQPRPRQQQTDRQWHRQHLQGNL